ncbi:hypothetical protein BFJ66_g11998 [Fusarium oxysporum f. sp. cepae]|uniref:Myb-like domain-containing protein n=1 Tax=Fusarium oxysporum f. sp. cepae TaxID=396571 RepID=A0A3L6NS81_FUSOX|nr:hypothetical protein BFJ65_g4504 [Fusarium oxysporum f. sp. cepae]RKK39388.1 hypothetical protein BFJ66_g11998 [Fusarium oxysporum f. sp. cepae]RKK50779.1 hypothetical protein BFJ67_g6294 [Fusarium oxysporum f. sp. cepae]
MPQFPFKTPTLAEYKQNQEYYDRLYEGLREIWYNHNSAVPGFVELPEDCVPRPPTVNQASSSRAGPNPNSPTMHCDKQLGRDCNKACCKPTPKAQGRRVTIATASDEENGVVTDTEGNITDSSNRVVKGKMTAKGKGKDKAVQTESENEPSAAQTDDDASTDAETSVLSFVACLKDPNWSLSEDCRLRSMKEAGETWTFISDSLCKTKDDVRARWKILQSQLRATDTDTDTDTTAEEGSVDDTTDEDEEGDDEEASGQESDEDEDDEDSDSDDEDSDDDTSSEDMSETKTRKSTVANKWHKGARNLKVAKENQEAKARAKAKTSGKDVSSADEAKDESDDDSSLFRYGDREKREQMKYLQEHVYGAMYPPYIHPQPDAYLGKRDCALLATIDSKYKRSRWLEMQANFYNVTGRMVPLESLKARCERAEAEKTERSKTRELERRMNKVEDWIAKQEREKSADSEDSEDSDDTDESDNSDDSDDPEDSGDSDE